MWVPGPGQVYGPGAKWSGGSWKREPVVGDGCPGPALRRPLTLQRFTRLWQKRWTPWEARRTPRLQCSSECHPLTPRPPGGGSPPR